MQECGHSGCLPEQHTAPFVLKAKQAEAALKQLDQNKATGPDGFHPAILGPIAYILAGALAQLFNRFRASATLPAEWTTMVGQGRLHRTIVQ
ncbi:unnamed protein product [Echinostoma caproni]|uniref:Cobalamin biosynthesis protein CobD n=1 Tax=Echinostoma caproni TaxID=27848 RepID=A0A183B7V0_9TREM|nr:unnamed protein product [Echinostoma caproni]